MKDTFAVLEFLEANWSPERQKVCPCIYLPTCGKKGHLGTI